MIRLVSLLPLLLVVACVSGNVHRLEPIHVMEEPPIGTLIIDLASRLDIHDLATSDYKFRFYSPHSITAHYFLIDQLTGHVKTQRSLDREYLCETKACGPCTSDHNCTLPIQIVAGTATTAAAHHNNHVVQQKFVSFDVVIEDKNEFAPQFARPEIVLNINENTPFNFSIPIDGATDRDSRQMPIVYSIVPVKALRPLDDFNQVIPSGLRAEADRLNARIRLVTAANSNSVFKQKHSSAAFSSSHNQQLNLVIREPFDYEQEKELSFKIMASDSTGAPQSALIGSCLVTLKIVDLNDNLPVFDRQEYEYRLDEVNFCEKNNFVKHF